MNKYFQKTVAAVTTLLLSSSMVHAFEIKKSLSEQLDLLNQMEIDNDGKIQLQSEVLGLASLSISPDYENDQTMYLRGSKELYKNSNFAAAFYQDANWPAISNDPGLSVSFASNYRNSEAMLMSNSEKAYVSFNNGLGWSEYYLNTSDSISAMVLGPAFDVNQQLYLVSSSGLLRQGASGNAELILASDSDGEVKSFFVSPSSTNDRIFYVLKGDKLLKTESMGDGWLEYKPNDKINSVVIEDDNTNSGVPLVLVGEKTLKKGDGAMNFASLNVPESVSKIYQFTNIDNALEHYIINTNDGIYITYNNANSWNKIAYNITDFSKVKALQAIMVSGEPIIFYILNDKLYRDIDATGIPEEYMTGINLKTAYSASGTAVSKNLIPLSGKTFDPGYKINEATLWADADLKGQTAKFYMTTDDVNWEEVTPNVLHTFEHQGQLLKWKIEMSTADTSVSPVVNSVMVDFGFDVVPTDECAGFKDVQIADENCAAIQYVKDQGIFGGYDDGTFRPNDAINRAEVVKVITLGFDKEILARPDNNLGFSDVDVENGWYMEYLATAIAEKIIAGYPDGTFKPAQTAKYNELIKVFFETANVELAPPTDVWYANYLKYAKDNGYLVYTNLEAPMTRGDVATLFYQYSQK